MIPPFDPSGWLPPGIHPATLAEIDERFGRSSEIRRAQMESVRWMIDLAVRAGAKRIILNGSFVTARIEPNDVDCALLFPGGKAADQEVLDQIVVGGLPYLQMEVAAEVEFDKLVYGWFASDRLHRPKGMVEVIL